MYGLALSGGGARGAAHVGVLRALIENGLAPDCIAGTSSGSMVAATYALNERIEDVDRLMRRVARMGTRLLDFNLSGALGIVRSWLPCIDFTFMGLFKGNRLERMMRRATRNKRLSDTSIPVAIPAVDLIEARLYVFASHPAALNGEITWQTNASLAEAVRASTSIPVVFCPKDFDSAMLVDGGVVENLPVSALRRLGARRVLGVSLATKGDAQCVPANVLDVASRSLAAIQIRLGEIEESMADHVLSVALEPGGVFSFDRIEEYERAGYEAAMRAMPALKAQFSADVAAHAAPRLKVYTSG